jgi:hypothetical protein
MEPSPYFVYSEFEALPGEGVVSDPGVVPHAVMT